MARTLFGPKSSSMDYVFISLLVMLVVFGLVMLTSASTELSKTKFNDSAYYLKHQLLIGVLPGIVGFLIGYFVYYRVWEKLAPYLLIFGILTLLLVFIPGFSTAAKGAQRWIDIGGFSFQPGEFVKLTFFIYLAAWISKGQQRGKNFWGGLVPFCVLIGLVVLLLLMQPATTTAGLIFLTSLIVYFTSGAKIRFVAALALVACLGFIMLVIFNPFASSSYRMTRINTYLNKDADVTGKGYQVNQAQLAIGAGGMLGVGFGQSTTKLHLPEPMGDSIFAVIGEELGFVGATLFLLVYLTFIWRGLRIARYAGDNFGRYLTTSFMSLFGLQAFVNIGAISGVIPMTGVPLPFISYGGTAIFVFLTMCGIIANISKYHR